MVGGVGAAKEWRMQWNIVDPKMDIEANVKISGDFMKTTQ